MLSMGRSGEDYLETIFCLEQSNGIVKSVDIAKKQNVSRPSVNKAINNLKKLGFVTQQSYGSIHLTSTGRERALEIVNRHRLLTHFLIDVLHVSPSIAEKDACGMEHALSDETFEKLNQFLVTLSHDS